MKLKGKLKAIIKVTYSEHVDICGSREESTQLFDKKSSRGVHKYGEGPVRPGCWGHQKRFEDSCCAWHHSVGWDASSGKEITKVGYDGYDKGH